MLQDSNSPSNNVCKPQIIVKCPTSLCLNAKPVSLWKILQSLLCNICRYKRATLLVTVAISFILATILSCYDIVLIKCPCTLSSLIDWNIAVVTICIAALAILFGLFAGRKFAPNAAKAFKEQLTTIFLCCSIQICALFFTLLSTNKLIITFLQIWSTIIFLDMLIELYTTATAITCTEDTDETNETST